MPADTIAELGRVAGVTLQRRSVAGKSSTSSHLDEPYPAGEDVFITHRELGQSGTVDRVLWIAGTTLITAGSGRVLIRNYRLRDFFHRPTGVAALALDAIECLGLFDSELSHQNALRPFNDFAGFE